MPECLRQTERIICEAAVDSSAKHSMQLLGIRVHDEWLGRIFSKVGSIVRNEISPLVCSQRPCQSKKEEMVINAIGEFLGIAYLADFALEEARYFDVEAACTEVERIGGLCDVNCNVVNRLLTDLIVYYKCEESQLFSDAEETIFQRYILKSTDVYFSQLLAIYGLRITCNVTDTKMLRFACVALEVLDDIIDVEEDSKLLSSNPFVLSYKSNSSSMCLFEDMAKHCMPILSLGNVTVKNDSVKAYINKTIERVDAVHEQMVTWNEIFATI